MKRFVCFGLTFAVCQAILVVQVSAQQNLPSSIRVDRSLSNGCYVFTDQVEVTPKSTKQALSTSPVLPSFFGKRARLVDCADRHHFQVFNLRTERVARNSSQRPGEFCTVQSATFKVGTNSETYKVSTRTFVSSTSRRVACLISNEFFVNPQVSGAFFVEEKFGDVSALWKKGS